MYLCIGVLLTLITKFKKGRLNDKSEKRKERLISDEQICRLLFETMLMPGEEYNKTHASNLKNCKENLKHAITNYMQNYNLFDEQDAEFLHNELEIISNHLLTKVLNPNYVKSFIESVIIIIEHDDHISSNTIVGMNPEYTRNNILNWRAFDAKEFLINILYYTFTLEDNRKGASTLPTLNDAFIEERIQSLNYISSSSDNGKQKLTFNFSQTAPNTDLPLLPHELTNTMVIRTSAQNVLFRENEFNKIIDSIQKQKSPNILLHGMGGCGKTSLARMIYCHLKDNYDCCGWINYSGSIKQSMITSINIEDYSDKTMIENDAQKKWQLIQRKLANSTQSKLLVIDNVDNIDGVQSPRQDKDLIAMSSWNNMTIIITSRLSDIPGYSNILTINNLGDANNYDNCIELFYHYNPDAAHNRSTNYNIVKNLCSLAGYNTMVIELLAKGSIYHCHNLETFYNELINNNFSCANDIPVETLHDFTVIKTNNSTSDYYDIGNETLASQIFKLFNLKTRSLLQQLILWDFHCLPENEKVSITELQEWMGFSLKDITPLLKEGWIKKQDGYFYIHPLVNQAVSCSRGSYDSYWKTKRELIEEDNNSNVISSSILNNTFFKETDGFELALRKLIFVDCLTYNGEYLNPSNWINIADFARKHGNIKIGIKYYKKAYNYYVSQNTKNNNNFNKLHYWKCTYFYGYMLSYTKAGYEEAERLLTHALEISEEILHEEGQTDDNIIILATSLDHLGYIQSNSLNNNLARITKTEYNLTQAVKLRQVLCTSHPNHFRLLHDYAWSLDNLGAFYSNIEIGNIEFISNETSNDILYLTRDEIIANKQQSEVLLRTALEIRKALAKARGDNTSTEVAWTYFNLANLLMSLNNDSFTYTSTNSNNPKQELYASLKLNEQYISSTYINYIESAYSQNRLNDAEKFINKALEIYEQLDIKYPGQHISSEARTLVLYGKLLKQIPTRQAEADVLFKKALNLYTILDNENPGRYETEMDLLVELKNK